MLKRVLVLLGLTVTVFSIFIIFAHAASSDFPPEELLQRIRPEGLRAHMAFLADDLLEGRGTGTRGFSWRPIMSGRSSRKWD